MSSEHQTGEDNKAPKPEPAHRLAKALELILRTQGVLPDSAIESLAQIQQAFAEVPTLLLDATERPVQRPQAVMDRRADYSGKKRLMRKNTLIADPQRYIHYLGPTTAGSTHDYQLLKQEFEVNLGLLDLFEVLAELGHLGLVGDYDLPAGSLPHRKPQRSKWQPDTHLTAAQRADN